MMPKSGWTPTDYQEYTVFPLEGVWRMDTDAWQGGALDKTKLKYRLMIRQPWFVTPDVAGRAMESARKKVPAELLERASFETFTDGPSVQMLHVGPYDTEPETFSSMNAFMKGGSGIVSPGFKNCAKRLRIAKNFSLVQPASEMGAS